jgi:hypothetical protein
MRTRIVGSSNEAIHSDDLREADCSISLPARKPSESCFHSSHADDKRRCRLRAAGFTPDLSLPLKDGIQPLAGIPTATEISPASNHTIN